MFTVRQPTIDQIRDWLAAQSSEQLSYEAAQSSKDRLPPGFHHIDWTDELGQGEAIFEGAKKALQQWACFNLSWTRVYGEGQPQTGKHLAIVARAGGLWVVNFCRVIEVQLSDESYSVIVGTLPNHVACGEERLSVHWDRATDSVTFNIRSFSRPRQWWMRLATPFIRRQQTRFCRDATAAMGRFIRAHARGPLAGTISSS